MRKEQSDPLAREKDGGPSPVAKGKATYILSDGSPGDHQQGKVAPEHRITYQCGLLVFIRINGIDIDAVREPRDSRSTTPMSLDAKSNWAQDCRASWNVGVISSRLLTRILPSNRGEPIQATALSLICIFQNCPVQLPSSSRRVFKRPRNVFAGYSESQEEAKE